MTADLVQFLRARLDDDERSAKAAEGIKEWHAPQMRSVMAVGFDRVEPYDVSLRDMLRSDISLMPFGAVAVTDYDADAKFIARHDPARALTEVNAKRGILKLYEEPEQSCALPDSLNKLTSGVQRSVLAVVLQHLALLYADHPDYRDEWRP